MSQPQNPEAVARAEAKFTKQQERAREGQLAMADYRAENRATDEKTARLRAARLAKEEQDKVQREADQVAQAEAKAQAGEARKQERAKVKEARASAQEAAAAFVAKRRTLKAATEKTAPKPRARKAAKAAQ